jgi:hypothetical protein
LGQSEWIVLVDGAVGFAILTSENLSVAVNDQAHGVSNPNLLDVIKRVTSSAQRS